MDKGDIQFAISLALALLGFFGTEWEWIKSRFVTNPSGVAMKISRRQRFFEGLIVAGLLMSTWGWYSKYNKPPTVVEKIVTFTKPYEFEYSENVPLKFVSGQTFVNREVPLDNMQYAHCIFENIKFVYNGKGDFQLINNTFRGSTTVLRTENPALGSYGALLSALGYLSVPASQIFDLAHQPMKNVQPLKRERVPKQPSR